VSRLVVPAGQPLMTVGRYTLFGEIAKGGMATVHFGRMCSLGGFSKTVAIKRMRKDIALDPEFVAMFLDEARLAARIEHPNVVATLDVVADSGEVFLVMEYVKGETLARLGRASEGRAERVPVPVAASVICGALNGLHAAHEAVGESGQRLEIVHRDVSPQNVLVGEDGVARITDFGIAKAETRLQVTQDGQMKGKLGYMAPEQLGHGGNPKIDRRVDLFTAAIVFWEMLAGRRLFLAETPAETIGNILTGSIPPLSSLRDDVPAALDQVIARALSRDANGRPATADAFAIAIEEAVDHRMASPRLVGNWVMSLAGNTLENRNRYVREIESIASMQTPGAAARPPEPSQHAAADHPASHPHQEQLTPGGAPRPKAQRAAMPSQPRQAMPSQPRPPMPSQARGLPAPPRYPGMVASAPPQSAPVFAPAAEPQPLAAPIVVPPPAPVAPPVSEAVAPVAPPFQPVSEAVAPVPAAPAEPISVVSSHDVSSGSFSSSALAPDPITSGNPMELEARVDSLMPPARGVSRAVLIGGGAALAVAAVVGIIVVFSGGSGSAAVSEPASQPTTASTAPTQAPVPSAEPVASDTPPPAAASSEAPDPSSSTEASALASAAPKNVKGQPTLVPVAPPLKKPPAYLPERP